MWVKLLQPIPEGWTYRQGAAFQVQGVTAMYGLWDQGNLGRRGGQCVLVHLAADGCGQFALEICRSHGACVIATVGSEKKVGYLFARFPWLEQIIVRDASRCDGSVIRKQLKQPWVVVVGPCVGSRGLIASEWKPSPPPPFSSPFQPQCHDKAFHV